MIEVGTQVQWTSRTTGEHHTGRVVSIMEGLRDEWYKDHRAKPYLVAPDGAALLWCDWLSASEIELVVPVPATTKGITP